MMRLDEHGLMIERLKRIQTLVIRQSVWSFFLGGVFAFILADVGIPFIVGIWAIVLVGFGYYIVLNATRPLR